MTFFDIEGGFCRLYIPEGGLWLSGCFQGKDVHPVLLQIPYKQGYYVYSITGDKYKALIFRKRDAKDIIRAFSKRLSLEIVPFKKKVYKLIYKTKNVYRTISVPHSQEFNIQTNGILSITSHGFHCSASSTSIPIYLTKKRAIYVRKLFNNKVRSNIKICREVH